MSDDSPRQAGARQSGELEITEEMIEAGLACFNQWWRNGGNDFGPPTEEMLADVFRAMLALSELGGR